MTFSFFNVLPFVAIEVSAPIFATAQDSGVCEPLQKRFGVMLDSTAPAGVMRSAVVGTGWGGSAAGLKSGDEILDVNTQKGPSTGFAAQMTFLNTQPVSGNAFRIKRAGVVTTLSVDKTCPHCSC